MMKRNILILFLTLFLYKLSNAQDLQPPVETRRTAISIIPQSFFASGLEAAFERMVGPKGSFKFYAGYYTAEDHYLYGHSAAMTGYKLELQPRLYINGDQKGLDGFFFGGSINYRNTILDHYKENGLTYDIDAKALGVGFVFGQQVLGSSGFSFEWFIGGTLISPLNTYDQDKVHLFLINPYKRGIVPKAGISIGFAF